MPNKLWSNGDPTPVTITAFTHGDCWLLAYYMSKQLDKEMAIVGGKENWIHVVTKLDEDKYLDVFGIWNSEGLRTKWLGPNWEDRFPDRKQLNKPIETVRFDSLLEWRHYLVSQEGRHQGALQFGEMLPDYFPHPQIKWVANKLIEKHVRP